MDVGRNDQQGVIRMNATQQYDPTLQAIVFKLNARGISGAIVAVRCGPVVSTVLFQPDAATRVSAIQRAAADLSIAAHGQVRLFTMPSSGAVGIEYPNAVRQAVMWLQLIWSDAIRNIPLNRHRYVYGLAPA
jgi:hypothetical protein